MDAVSIRGEWVGQVIDGRFPLVEWLGGSSGNGVFATELPDDGSRRAAIKLIPASARAEDRLQMWSTAAALSHPHLLRIVHYGRAEIDDTQLVYVVTDFADEVLSQIIPERPLSASETKELLEPVLDALQYLHEKGLVHGHLKPSNILVVENGIKLSSDSLLRIDSATPDSLANDVHIAPESAGNPVAPAADIWSLGVTVVEALTQEPPIWDAASTAEPAVPASVPEPFSTIAHECLHPDPSHRCTVGDVRAMLEGKPDQPAVEAPPAVRVPHEEHRLADRPVPRKMPLVPVIVGFVLLVGIIAGLTMHSHKTQPASPEAETTQGAPAATPQSEPPTPQAPPSTPAPQLAAPSTRGAGTSSGDIVTRDVPDVPRNASNTIHGTVAVVVRVSLDGSGGVSDAEFASHGSSAYFARLALESARKWKFKAPQRSGQGVESAWLLHYAFRHDGVEVRPEEDKPR